MKNGSVNFLIGGPAGSGIEKSGQILAMTFMRNGYYVFANIEHSSQIRGGNNFLRIRVDDVPHEIHQEEIDIIIAFDQQTIDDHIGDLADGGVILYDSSSYSCVNTSKSRRVICAGVPFKKIATEEIGNPIVENVVALGMAVGLLGFDVVAFKNSLKKVFGNKSAEILRVNEKAAERGFEIAKENYAKDFPIKIAPKKVEKPNMFLCGNDAFCIGAIKAGVKFVGEYPMTPSSSVLHFMATWADKYGIVVKHVEDEIAAVNSIIGAGFAGVRACAATSGGGFALMTEGIGLASMNEVPIVVVNVMRPGPATGLPTRSGQGDLRQAIHAGQDDPVKIVIAPGDLKECFEMGFESFNLAEKYQVPVILTYDKFLGESFYTSPAFDEKGMKIDRGKLLSEADLAKNSEYKRYLRTSDGVSPRAIPGQKGGIHRATSDEHTEFGEICEDAENRKLMVEKRMKKLEAALPDLPKPLLIGDKNADITFVTWTSSKAACIEACEELGGDSHLRGNDKNGKKKALKANVLQIRTLYPFHKKEVADILKKVKRPILVEQNFTSQLGGLIAEETGIIIEEKILKYDGRPLTAKNIIENLK